MSEEEASFEDEGLLDRLADRIPEADRAAVTKFGEAFMPMSETNVMQEVAYDEQLIDLDKGEIDTFDKAVHEQTLVASGVDVSPLKSVDPHFDPLNFCAIARETFLKVKEARGATDKAEGDALLSPAMQTELNNAIDGDVAAHRHHLLSGLQVDSALIVSASVDGGHERVGVRLQVTGEELDRSGRDLHITAGDETVHHWSELWQFERDPTVDTSAEDERHELNVSPDGWMVAHRGWVVTSIQRLPG